MKVAYAYFHFNSDVEIKIKSHLKKVQVDNNLIFSFDNCLSLNLEKFDLPRGFNKTNTSRKLIVKFNGELKTKIAIL